MRKVAVKVVTGIGFVVVLLFSMSAFAAQTKAFEFPLQNKTISLGSDVTAIKSAFPQIKKTKAFRKNMSTLLDLVFLYL